MAKALGNRDMSLGPESCAPQLTEEEALRTGRGRVPHGPKKVQQMPTRFAEGGQSVAEKVTDWKETAEETLSKVRQSTSAAYEESKARARAMYEQARQTSGEVSRRVRVRAQYLSDEYPVQIIASVAGVAFIVGVLLRFWRSKSS